MYLLFSSIGSLGWDAQEAGVQNVTLKTATFTGTENGVRVKTWARPSNGFVRDVLFQHVVIVNVQNPIIIDQDYCPNHENCPNKVIIGFISVIKLFSLHTCRHNFLYIDINNYIFIHFAAGIGREN